MKIILLLLVTYLTLSLCSNWFTFGDNLSMLGLNEDHVETTNPGGPYPNVHIWFDVGNRVPQFEETDGTKIVVSNTISVALKQIFGTADDKPVAPNDEDYLIFYDATSGAGWHILQQYNILLAVPANSTSNYVHFWISWGPARAPMFFQTDYTKIQYSSDYATALKIMLSEINKQKLN